MNTGPSLLHLTHFVPRMDVSVERVEVVSRAEVYADREEKSPPEVKQDFTIRRHVDILEQDVAATECHPSVVARAASLKSCLAVEGFEQQTKILDRLSVRFHPAAGTPAPVGTCIEKAPALHEDKAIRARRDQGSINSMPLLLRMWQSRSDKGQDKAKKPTREEIWRMLDKINNRKTWNRKPIRYNTDDLIHELEIVHTNRYISRQRVPILSEMSFALLGTHAYCDYLKELQCGYTRLEDRFRRIRHKLTIRAEKAGLSDIHEYRRTAAWLKENVRQTIDYAMDVNLSYHPSRVRVNKTLGVRYDKVNENLSIRDFYMIANITTGKLGWHVLARTKSEKELVELQIYSKRRLIFHDLIPEIAFERDVCLMLISPFIQYFKYSFHDAAYLYNVAAPSTGETFNDFLNTYGHLTEDEARFYIAQVILALEHLHSVFIIHRDVNPETIKMRANGYIMLGGFHNATMLMKAWRDRTRDKLYREDYHTLEQRRAKGKEFMADFWSLGTLLHEMVLGNSHEFHSIHSHLVPDEFAAKQDTEEEGEIRDSRKRVVLGLWEGPFCMVTETLSTPLRVLLESFLKYTPEERLGYHANDWKVLRKDPWLQPTRWEAIINFVHPLPGRMAADRERDLTNGVPLLSDALLIPGRNTIPLDVIKQRVQDKCHQHAGLFDEFFKML